MAEQAGAETDEKGAGGEHPERGFRRGEDHQEEGGQAGQATIGGHAERVRAAREHA